MQKQGNYDEPFESNVIYIGTKTATPLTDNIAWFESNVIYIGTKTKKF